MFRSMNSTEFLLVVKSYNCWKFSSLRKDYFFKFKIRTEISAQDGHGFCAFVYKYKAGI